MKKTYKIEVDCASCALKMEDATKTVSGALQKMTVEFGDGQDDKKVMKAVLKACRKVEDDCEIDF